MTPTIKRKKTRSILVGSVQVGGNNPITVQSMTTTKTDDVNGTVAQILKLESAGCDIVRVAVPDTAAASAIHNIKSKISIPLIADIHFDYKLAIKSAKSGADALRFNPGNITNKRKIRTLVSCAKDYKIPIRIGVNAGSLEKKILQKYNGPSAQGMVDSALRHIQILQELDFNNIKISMKSSNVSRTIKAYRVLSAKTDLPLHIGITEAGTIYTGIVKSAIGIGSLLAEGIGDTIRVSLTCDPVEEVRVGFEILRALSIRKRGPEIISCPTCGRCEIDLFKIAERVEKATSSITRSITVAIMGCIVNGPGEAKEADVGIAGGKGIGILFKKGKIIKKIHEKQLVNVLLTEIYKLEHEHRYIVEMTNKVKNETKNSYYTN